jgi:DNA-binding NarL/FixJ family response regulator
MEARRESRAKTNMNATLSSKASGATSVRPSAGSPVTQVAVVEDNAGLRRSWQRLLTHAPGMQCVGAWGSGELALPQLAALRPDVVLMDINLPGMSGIECTARLKASCPATQVVMVTVYEDTDSIFRALKAGACGYLLKRATSDEMIAAINEVRTGGAPMTSEIARKVVHAFQAPAPDPGASVALSAREREILDLLSQGFANKEIADRLNIAYQTVKVHLKHIYEKLHVRSRTEALLKYMSDKGSGPELPSLGTTSGDGRSRGPGHGGPARP